MIDVHVLASRVNRAGGADVYTCELLSRLPSHGFNVTVICHDADVGAVPSCRVLAVDRGRSNDLPLVWRVSPLLQLTAIEKNLRRLGLQRPAVVLGMAHQIIWAHRRVWGPLPLVYLPHSMIAPVEVSTYRWGSKVKRATATWLWGHLEMRYLNAAETTVRFTNAGCKMLLEHYGTRVQPRFAVIPQAVAIPPFIQRSAPVGPEKRLLSVGRLVRSKNLDFLLRTLAAIPEGAWILDILGEGEEKESLQELSRALGLADRVHFHGHVAPHAYYQHADLLVAPSRLENASLVLLEAMAWGIPTISIQSNGRDYINANDEMVVDALTGYLAKSEEDFAGVLSALLRIPSDALRAVGERARESVKSKHSWDSHAAALSKILEEVATRPCQCALRADCRTGRVKALP